MNDERSVESEVPRLSRRPARRIDRPRAAIIALAVAIVLVSATAATIAYLRHDGSQGVISVPATSAAGIPSSVALSSSVAPPSTATTAPPALEVRFRVLTVVSYGNLEPPRATVTLSQDDLPALWALRRAEGSAPTIDFAAEVVVSMVIPDDGCPPELDGFDLAANALSPVFVETVSTCGGQPLIPLVFIVAIQRASLPEHAILRLPRIERSDPLPEEQMLLN
jgi:hypothetical protein